VLFNAGCNKQVYFQTLKKTTQIRLSNPEKNGADPSFKPWKKRRRSVFQTLKKTAQIRFVVFEN